MNNLNNKNADPTISDLFSVFKKEIFLDMNCHAIAKVEEFDSETQTIKAIVQYKKKRFVKVGNDYKPKFYDYPALLDVPVICLRGGEFSMRFPIAKGDTCLILFNDRDLDAWFESGQVGPLSTARLHSFSDGVALVGLSSRANLLENYDSNKFQLTDGNALVELSSESSKLSFGDTKVELKSKINIENSSDSLKAVLEDLIDQIKLIVTSNSGTVNTASGVRLDGVKERIGGLLE